MGDTLEFMSISFLIGFYSIITLIVSQALWTAFRRLEALLVEADNLPPEATIGYATRQTLSIPMAAKVGIVSAVIVSHLALCLYIYQISG